MKTSINARQGFKGVLLGLVLLCSRVASAYTAPPTAPTSSATGSYSVSWAPQCTTGCYSQWLEEKAGAGNFVSVSGSSPVVYTGKTAGQYSYRLVRLLSSWSPPYYTLDYSSEITVNVGGSLPPLDPLLTQRSYQYQTRVGDIDYDGRRDLFIQRVSGGVANNGVLDKIVVQQTATPGQYVLVPPSAAQAATAAAWPLSSAPVAVEDINVDGFVDVTVKGVASALGVSGAANLIVYSPGAPFASMPKGVRAVDSDLLRFVGNMLDYEVDQSYFVNNATYIYYTLSYAWSTCGDGGVFAGDPTYGWGMGCIWVYQDISGYYPDYSQFSSAALAISDAATKAANGQTSPTAAVDAIDRAAEGVLKTTIGGWGMEEVLGASGEHTNPDARRALEVFWSILGVARADAAEVKAVKAPSQTPRTFGTVYVTGHHVFGLGPIHTAIEYTSVVRPTTTISAGPEGTLPYLVSRVNRPTDNAALNMVLGTVNDPQSPSAEAFYAELLLADANYDDDLRYALFPVSGSYNSNSYVRGVIDATGGVSSVNLASFVGGNQPVPASKFQ